MATNRDLVDQVNALAKRLNVSVKTEDLSSDQLSELIAKLQKQAGAPVAEPPAAAADPAKKSPYAVAPGQSLIINGAVVDAGGEVNAADVGGPGNLAQLVQNGLVVKQ